MGPEYPKSWLMALTFLPLEDGWIESCISDLVEVGTLDNRELVAGGENWLPERPEPKALGLKVVEREGSWPVGLARLFCSDRDPVYWLELS